MTLEELKTNCETQGYQPNRATVLKLLEMIAVLREGNRRHGMHDHANALRLAAELERSL